MRYLMIVLLSCSVASAGPIKIKCDKYYIGLRNGKDKVTWVKSDTQDAIMAEKWGYFVFSACDQTLNEALGNVCEADWSTLSEEGRETINNKYSPTN